MIRSWLLPTFFSSTWVSRRDSQGSQRNPSIPANGGVGITLSVELAVGMVLVSCVATAVGTARFLRRHYIHDNRGHFNDNCDEENGVDCDKRNGQNNSSTHKDSRRNASCGRDDQGGRLQGRCLQRRKFMFCTLEASLRMMLVMIKHDKVQIRSH